ncbi:hypothetical protein BDP81DRAFT_443367 [Colletotrichum phormii]|uniref:Uncharacterized protein n=1 Tax=Colletotrichum phormii TaxID=359342 RepID=A0AAI9ZCB0_9PEZI|nr:uncharacterized protein BDP81DRAFT_443367 [Colletotrichum phormii]KAK1621598.1 hypothetical protein BDP81DRAFT_443367 [Colletotrichum phormii]
MAPLALRLTEDLSAALTRLRVGGSRITVAKGTCINPQMRTEGFATFEARARISNAVALVSHASAIELTRSYQ